MSAPCHFDQREKSHKVVNEFCLVLCDFSCVIASASVTFVHYLIIYFLKIDFDCGNERDARTSGGLNFIIYTNLDESFFN